MHYHKKVENFPSAKLKFKKGSFEYFIGFQKEMFVRE